MATSPFAPCAAAMTAVVAIGVNTLSCTTRLATQVKQYGQHHLLELLLQGLGSSSLSGRLQLQLDRPPLKPCLTL